MLDRDPRILALTVAALLVAPLAAALTADNQPLQRIADGDFDHGGPSLRMPAIGPFPLIVGGWGARGGADAAVVLGDDDPALELRSRPGAPAHLIQDVPVGTRSFRLSLEVMRVRGRQTLQLLSDWDREDPMAAEPLLALRLGANSSRVDAGAVSWRVERGLDRRRWVTLEIVSDTRDGRVEIYLDDALLLTVPGALTAAPRTVILGPGPDDDSSLYRYDAVSLIRTADAELAALRRATLRWAPASALPHVQDRLDAAAVALSRGAYPLAAPELRAAGRLLERAPAADDPEVAAGRRQLTVGLERLLQLL